MSFKKKLHTHEGSRDETSLRPSIFGITQDCACVCVTKSATDHMYLSKDGRRLFVATPNYEMPQMSRRLKEMKACPALMLTASDSFRDINPASTLFHGAHK